MILGTLAVVPATYSGSNIWLQLAVLVFILLNIYAILLVALSGILTRLTRSNFFVIIAAALRKVFVYEVLAVGAFFMLVPFYWMVVTAFKDGKTSSSPVPIWTPSRIQTYAPDPETKEMIAVTALGTASRKGEKIPVVPNEALKFRTVDAGHYTVTMEVPEADRIFNEDPDIFETQMVWSLDLKNFRRAWYRPEATSRGQVNFLTYFMVSIITSVLTTTGALTTSALAAFAFARLNFFGKSWLFYLILATMMVPGQVLLIPNFLILSALRMLDTYAALVVPWLGSVFTIFLMRQFFMTVPDDLWDASRIDGASRFRFLWQIVVPLSKPVFITAGIFDFLANWNSLLWPLIVTSTPTKRTLMVGLQNLSTDAGNEFHILMAASCFAVLPIIIGFFFVQRFFIEGIARTGLK